MNAKRNLGTAEMFHKAVINVTLRKTLSVCIVVHEDSNNGAITEQSSILYCIHDVRSGELQLTDSMAHSNLTQFNSLAEKAINSPDYPIKNCNS